MFSTEDIQNVDVTMRLLVVVRAGRPAAAPIIIGGDLLPLDPMLAAR